MKLVSVALFSLVGVAAANSDLPLRSIVDQWEEFKAEYGRKYASKQEELQKFHIFAENVQKLEKLHASDGGSAQFSHLSPLADWSEEEFNARNALRVTKEEIKEHAEKAITVSGLNAVSLPGSFGKLFLLVLAMIIRFYEQYLFAVVFM